MCFWAMSSAGMILAYKELGSDGICACVTMTAYCVVGEVSGLDRLMLGASQCDLEETGEHEYEHSTESSW